MTGNWSMKNSLFLLLAGGSSSFPLAGLILFMPSEIKQRILPISLDDG